MTVDQIITSIIDYSTRNHHEPNFIEVGGHTINFLLDLPHVYIKGHLYVKVGGAIVIVQYNRRALSAFIHTGYNESLEKEMKEAAVAILENLKGGRT